MCSRLQRGYFTLLPSCPQYMFLHRAIPLRCFINSHFAGLFLNCFNKSCPPHLALWHMPQGGGRVRSPAPVPPPHSMSHWVGRITGQHALRHVMSHNAPPKMWGASLRPCLEPLESHTVRRLGCNNTIGQAVLEMLTCQNGPLPSNALTDFNSMGRGPKFHR